MVVSRQVITLSPKPDETAGRLIARARDRLQEELAATAAIPPAEKIGEWILPAPQDRADTAVDDGSKALHDIVIGKPVEEIARGLGMSQDMSKALRGIAAVAPIPPVAAAFTAVKRVIQIGTIAWGAVTLNPVLVAAGVKAIVHDKVVETLEEGIERTLLDRGPAKAPDGRGSRSPVAAPPHGGRTAPPDPSPPTQRTWPAPKQAHRDAPVRRSQRHRPSRTPRRQDPGAGRTRDGPAPRG